MNLAEEKAMTHRSAVDYVLHHSKCGAFLREVEGRIVRWCIRGDVNESFKPLA